MGETKKFKGRVTEQYVAEQGTFRFAYDEDRRQNTCTGENGYYLSIVYDEDGRIIESIDNNSTKHIAYNKLNQRISYTDREGNTTEYEYDDAGNVSKITYADGTYERFEYDSNRQVTWMRDRNGN